MLTRTEQLLRLQLIPHLTVADADKTLSVVFASDAVKDLVAGTGVAETSHMYLIPVAAPEYTVEFTVVLDQNGATMNIRTPLLLQQEWRKQKSNT